MIVMVVIAPFVGGAERRSAPLRTASAADSQSEERDATTNDSAPVDNAPNPGEDDDAPVGGSAPLEMGLRPNMVDSAERVVRSSGCSRQLLAAFRPITRFGLLPCAMNLRLERVLSQVRSLTPTIEVEAPASRPHAPPTSA